MDKKAKDPLVALTFSVLFPGCGQIYAGKFFKGILFIIIQFFTIFMIIREILNPTVTPTLLPTLVTPENPNMPGILFMFSIIAIHIDSFMSAKKFNSKNNLTVKSSGIKKVSLIMLITVMVIFNPLAIMAALYARTYVVQPFRIPGNNMSPTLVKEDRILLIKEFTIPRPLVVGMLLFANRSMTKSCIQYLG